MSSDEEIIISGDDNDIEYVEGNFYHSLFNNFFSDETLS